jgi:N-acetylglutamate synthase-like GNAT family acetyltransferase
MTTIQIEPYQDADKEQLIDLILTIQTQEFGVPITIHDQPDLQNIPQFYQKDAGNFWVAKWDGLVIGTTALIDIGHAQCALRKMFVAKEHRGKEKNVAQKLLSAALAWAQSKKVREIYLGTTALFLAAHRFYEKNHFQEVAKEELPSQFPVMAIDTKFYVYRL